MGYFIGGMIPIVVVCAFLGFGVSRGKKNYALIGIITCVIAFGVWGTFNGFYNDPVLYAVVLVSIALMFIIILIDKKINPKSWNK